MKLLHFALPSQSSGETYMGVCLADQLREAGAVNHFAVTSAAVPLVEQHGHPYTVIDPTLEAPPRGQVDDLMARLRPDALVLADYLNYCTTMKHRFGTDPWFLRGYGPPVLPMDLSEWEDTDFAIDICGARFRLPVDRGILDMAAYLRPVPVGHLHAGSHGRGFPYRALAPEPPVAASRRARLRTDLGLGPADRLVVLPMSAWQQPSHGWAHPTDKSDRTSEMVDRLAWRVPDLLVHYLRQLPAGTHVAVVGPAPTAFEGLPSGRYHHVPSCPPEEYRALLRAADTVLSLCVPAVSAIRALLADAPVMVLSNRFALAGPDDVAALETELKLSDRVRAWLLDTLPVDPFRMWPKGAYHVQEAILRDNPYLTAVAHEELFDEAAVVATLTGILYEPDQRDRLAAARARYLGAVADLPPTAEVVAAALNRAGVTGA